MTRRKTDTRPVCRACREPFTPGTSQEFCRICDERRELALIKAQDLQQDLDEARRQLNGGVLRPLIPPPDTAELEERLAEKARELWLANHDLTMLRVRLAAAEMYRGAVAPTAVPPDILRILIGLAHPDRHENSEAATRATTWLLQARKAGRP